MAALELKTDGSTGPLTGTVTWATSACTPAGAVLLAPSGVNGNEIITGVLAGSCKVTAKEAALTGNTTVTVVTGSTHYAYISNSGSTDRGIGGYTVTASAATPLVPFAPPSLLSGNYLPIQPVVHPNGKYLYDIDASSFVHLYTVNATTGALTLSAGPTPSAGAGTFNYGVIDPTGRFLYVIDNGASTIELCTQRN